VEWAAECLNIRETRPAWKGRAIFKLFLKSINMRVLLAILILITVFISGCVSSSQVQITEIRITDIPKEVSITINEPEMFFVIVLASGGLVEDVWLELRNIPDNWEVWIEPQDYSFIAAHENEVFTVQIKVPDGEVGERSVEIVAHSSNSEDFKELEFVIFNSREDRIPFDITRLKEKLSELRIQAGQAALSSFDREDIDDMLEEAESEITKAENYFNEKKNDPYLMLIYATASIYTAEGLLEEVEDILGYMGF
jgi:hypothetical protein